MASLFGALGSLAQSYGLARQDVIKEREEQARARQEEERVRMEEEQIKQEGVRTQLEQSRLVFEQSQARRPFPMGQAYKKDGKWVQPIWDPLKNQGQGGLGEIEEGADENPLLELMRQVKEAGGNITPLQALNILHPQAAKAQDQYEERTIMAPGPDGKPVPTIAYFDKSDPNKPAIIKPQQAFERAPAGAAAELPEKTVAELANRWNKYGDVPPAKNRVQVESYMEEHGMGPGRHLSAQEQRVLEVAKQAQPKVAQLKKIIEDHGLTNESSFVFGNYSALAQHMRMRHIYGFGVKPDQVASDLIKYSGAIQVMGTAPWVVIGRGKYTTEMIQQHLPQPTDTPALLYDKLNFLQGILDDTQASISGAGAIRSSGAGGSARDLGAAPPGKQEGSTGSLPDGTRVVVRNGRLMSQ